MNHGKPLRIATFSILLAAGWLAADEKIDLDRRTPVPANEPIPIVDFFRRDLIEQPRINPSGTHVAALITAGEDRHKLVVYELGSNKVEVLEPTGENTIHNVTWLNDQRLAFGFGLYRTYSVGLFASEVGRLSQSYPLLQYAGATLLAVPQSRRTRPLAQLPERSMNSGQQAEAVVLNTDIRTGRVFSLISVSTSGNESNEIREANQKNIEKSIVGPKEGNSAGFLADKDGDLAFGFTASDGVFTMHRRANDNWEKTPVNLDEVEVLGYGRTRGEVIVRGPRSEGRPRPLQFMNAATGELGDVLVQDEAYDFHGTLYYDPGSRIVFGARFDRNGPAMAWFNETYVALQKVLNGYFPGLVVRLIGADEGGRVLLVETYSDRQPSSYYWINLEAKTVGPVERTMPWIDPERMLPMNMMTYKTRDGQQLDAYVTLPVGASKKNPVPLVVIPPGTPAPFRGNFEAPSERATWGFDRHAQFWASLGYAVLQPNHRGSAGYGWKFPEGDLWEFAKMADDVATATRRLVASGLIDPKRIAITGFGDSAHIAVAAAESDPELFRAVVAFHGIYDWARYLRAQKSGGFAGLNYGVLARNLGDERKLEENSVTARLDRIRAAVLVGYQREFGDTTAQSTALLSGLDHARVVNESLPIGSVRSTINMVRNQVELYSRAEAFLAKHLHPSPAAADAKGN
ncbi:MAG TPA: prolyl oligopeptidase family serine peptidase [Opitutaceae bacterium]